jgi:hypothetical protein
VGTSGSEEKNTQALPGLEPPIFQPVVQRCTTKLFWLLMLKKVVNKTHLNALHIAEVGEPGFWSAE